MEALDEQRIGCNRKDLRAPCKDCRKRHHLCHSDCEDYTSWQDLNKAKKEWLRQHQHPAPYDHYEMRRKKYK